MTYHPYYPPQRPMYPPVYRPPVAPPPPRRSRAKVIAIAAMVLTAIVLAMIMVVGLHSSTESSTTESRTTAPTSEITCPPGPADPRDGDCGFLYSMKANGYGSRASQQAEIRFAHQACTAIDQGTKLSGLHVIFKSYPGVSTSDAVSILGIGVSAYCPWAANAPDH